MLLDLCYSFIYIDAFSRQCNLQKIKFRILFFIFLLVNFWGGGVNCLINKSCNENVKMAWGQEANIT